jgi:trehalose 6-phosphate phosphatase
MTTSMTQHKASMAGRAAAVLQNPHGRALFIDIDGTLLEMAATPDAVRVPFGLVALLEDLVNQLDGAVALLTGRRIANADRLFHPLRLVVSGVHGTELRSERRGRIAMLAPPIPPAVVKAINDLSGIAAGILVERKGSGMAVHYRHAPLAQERLEAELRAIVGRRNDLLLRRGRMVLEVGPSGFSKGSALASLQARAPFAGRRPVMVGDDVGDESALLEAEKLGGVALRVAGEHFSRATADFEGVRGVHAWLRAFAAALRATAKTRAAEATRFPLNGQARAGFASSDT